MTSKRWFIESLGLNILIFTLTSKYGNFKAFYMKRIVMMNVSLKILRHNR